MAPETKLPFPGEGRGPSPAREYTRARELGLHTRKGTGVSVSSKEQIPPGQPLPPWTPAFAGERGAGSTIRSRASDGISVLTAAPLAWSLRLTSQQAPCAPGADPEPISRVGTDARQGDGPLPAQGHGVVEPARLDAHRYSSRSPAKAGVHLPRREWMRASKGALPAPGHTLTPAPQPQSKRSSCFPKFWPENRRFSVSGMLSKPFCMSSL